MNRSCERNRVDVRWKPRYRRRTAQDCITILVHFLTTGATDRSPSVCHCSIQFSHAPWPATTISDMPEEIAFDRNLQNKWKLGDEWAKEVGVLRYYRET